jgi:hypothetical protein
LQYFIYVKIKFGETLPEGLGFRRLMKKSEGTVTMSLCFFFLRNQRVTEEKKLFYFSARLASKFAKSANMTPPPKKKLFFNIILIWVSKNADLMLIQIL